MCAHAEMNFSPFGLLTLQLRLADPVLEVEENKCQYSLILILTRTLIHMLVCVSIGQYQ